jgi:glycosyltransferase involved in cell wall biosynthesis
MFESFNGLSVIIPTLNNPRGVFDLLKSIDIAVKPNNFEVLVVANLECAETRHVTSHFSFANYYCSHQIGANRARNLGVKSSKYDFVYFFDDDCVLESPNYFLDLNTHIKKLDEEIFLIGGSYTLPTSSTIPSRAYHQIQMNWLKDGKLNNRSGNAYLIGGNCGGVKEIFNKYPFDEFLLFGGTETEFFLKAYSKGFKIFYIEQLKVIHKTNLSLFQLCKKAALQAKGRAYLDSKKLFFNPIYSSLIFRSSDAPIAKSLFAYKFCFKTFYSFYSNSWGLSFLRWLIIKNLSRLILLWRSSFYRLANLIEIVISKK